jgi:ArsR family transcriptional regulator, arsenate/arsenite/antimonite-responsive transcriptional repressor
MSKYQTLDLEWLAGVFKALGNPHRLKILIDLGTCCTPGVRCCGERQRLSVGELGGELEIAASTLSHHVKELGRAGLVSCTKRGKCVLCCCDKQVLRSLSALFAALAGDAPLPEGWPASADITLTSPSEK